MLHVYIKTILHALEAHADVPASDVTVACYGAALQVHVPHAITLLGPNLSWELWRADAHAPLFEAHLSKKIDKRSGTIDDFLQEVSSRPERRFVCIVDLDLHVPPHVLPDLYSELVASLFQVVFVLACVFLFCLCADSRLLPSRPV